MRIGIFGGAFNPPHNEHIKIAKQAVKELKLDSLVVMPTYISPHKRACELSYNDRFNMIKYALEGEKKIRVSDFEKLKGDKSYTYQTIEEFAKDKENKLFLIVGGDSLMDFDKWVKPEIIAEKSTLCVVARGKQPNLKQKKKEIEKKYKAKVILLKVKGEEVSSTYVRYLSKLGCPIKDYVPKIVSDYLQNVKMLEYKQIFDYLIKNVKETRRIHTAGVIEMALKLNGQLGLDESKVICAAALHDVAKYLDVRDYPNFVPDSRATAPVMHAFLGEYIARRVFNVQDEQVLSAIKYHSTGKPNMTPLEKLIFTADLVERNRNYPSAEKLRQECLANFEKGFVMCIIDGRKNLKQIKKSGEVCSLTQEAFEYYTKK